MNIFYHIQNKQLYTVELVLPFRKPGGYYYEAIPLNRSDLTSKDIMQFSESYFHRNFVHKYVWR